MPYQETVGEQEVELLKNINALQGITVADMGEQEVQRLKQWLLAAAATVP